MPDADFDLHLDRLIGELDLLPAEHRDRLRAVAESTRHRQAQLRQTIDKLQETLDFLRLGVKYLVFDVEATKRENAYLRKMLDEANGDV